MTALTIVLFYVLLGVLTADLATLERRKRDSFDVIATVVFLIVVTWPIWWLLVLKGIIQSKGDQS